jgi:5-oxoprolinase (ATP-hydrolysing)
MSISDNGNNWKINIDTGGTFTDCLATDPDGKPHRCKVLSSSAIRLTINKPGKPNLLTIQSTESFPEDFFSGFNIRFLNYPGFSSVVEHYSAESQTLKISESLPDHLTADTVAELQSPWEAPILAARLVTATPAEKPLPPLAMRLSTTKATNALLERKGAKTLFFITEGFGDLLQIGNQQRPDLFSLEIIKRGPFYHQIVEVPERMDASGNSFKPLNFDEFIARTESLLDGVESAAVCLMNSIKNPDHEQKIAEYLKSKGVQYLSISSELSELIKIVPRAQTCDVNAFLAPVMDKYIGRVHQELNGGYLHIMSSTGSLSGMEQYRPKDALLSGPAGGVNGAASIGRRSGESRIITFDMGGTSTDVARYDDGFDYLFEHSVGDAHLQSPALAIETVAAGGGSICGFDGVSLTVGPESAGADPGPACYGAGGPLTITDVNLLTGRLDPSNFHFPVNLDAAKNAFHELFFKIREKQGDEVSGTEILEGYLDIANEKMAQAINTVSASKGFDPSEYALVAFGGAGGQHATAVASKLGIRKLLVPADAGLLSAYGLQQSRIEKIETLQCLEKLDLVENRLAGHFDSLRNNALEKLTAEGIRENRTEIIKQSIFARFAGQESTLEIEWNPGISIQKAFKKAYLQTYGHWIDSREIEIESIRLIMAESSESPELSTLDKLSGKPTFQKLRSIDYKGNRIELPVFDRSALKSGISIDGPALILDPYSTLFVEPGWEINVRSDLTIQLDYIDQNPRSFKNFADLNNRSEVIDLQLYINRFTAIAEQMGEMLRRTSMSVNVKERLDFSCALLDSDGYLVVNAPHIPVHLGAMGMCVRTIMAYLKEKNPRSFGNFTGLDSDLRDGDVIVTNHPAFGGSHLPDVTVVTPIFHNGKRIGFAASRAHHAEIGGKRPGSMPPDAASLAEEGVVIPPVFLSKGGETDLESIRRLFTESPWPTRSIEENMADLQAAVAANHLGMKELQKMADKFGADESLKYMNRIKSYAAERMRQTLQKMSDGNYKAEEKMDDGSLLKVSCNIQGDSMTIDFTGTGPVHPGNLNANPSIVNSVVMYVLRLLVNEPLPLNDGLLEPVKIILPEGTMLNPLFPR